MRRTRAAPSLAGRFAMVPQERDLITTLLARLKSAGGQPKDPEADPLIRQAMVEQPDAPYYLVQTVLIQDLSLHQAQNRIADLEGQLANAQASAKPTSFLGNLFGTSQPASPARSEEHTSELQSRLHLVCRLLLEKKKKKKKKKQKTKKKKKKQKKK